MSSHPFGFFFDDSDDESTASSSENSRNARGDKPNNSAHDAEKPEDNSKDSHTHSSGTSESQIFGFPFGGDNPTQGTFGVFGIPLGGNINMSGDVPPDMNTLFKEFTTFMNNMTNPHNDQQDSTTPKTSEADEPSAENPHAQAESSSNDSSATFNPFAALQSLLGGAMGAHPGEGFPPGGFFGFPDLSGAQTGATVEKKYVIEGAEGVFRTITESRFPTITEGQRKAVVETVNLAELWLNEVTMLPQSGNRTVTMTCTEWFTATLPVWMRIIEIFEKHQITAQQQTFRTTTQDADAEITVHPLLRIMSSMSAKPRALALGHKIAALSAEVFTGCDFGFPLMPDGVTALSPSRLSFVAQATNISELDILLFLATREAARARLFHHVPWLVEMLLSSLEEYAEGLYLDMTDFQETIDKIAGNTDSAGFAEALSHIDSLPDPTLRSSNDSSETRIVTLLALTEGWVQLVAEQALSERLASLGSLDHEWTIREEEDSSFNKIINALFSTDMKQPPIAQARLFWERVDHAVGMEQRDHLWDHPDFLPSAADVDKPAAFIDGLLSAQSSETFDPIAEITRLWNQRDDAPDEEPGSTDNS